MIKPGPAQIPVNVLSVDPLTGIAVIQVPVGDGTSTLVSVFVTQLAQYYHNDGSPYWPPVPMGT